MTNKVKPFISFVVFSYNQNRFIRDAVKGAFSQTCPPIEIILSDDHSTDETFSIMQEMAQDYSGPHEVVVRRNDSNLGLIEHINTVFAIARGEWVVVAAGDDISMPNRVAEIVRVISEYPDVNMVSSALIGMDEQGNHKNESCVFPNAGAAEPANDVITGLTELIENRTPSVHGATLAYSQELIRAFPPMPSGAVYEDAIFRFRSALLGIKAHINQPLVLYRSHPNQTTNVHAQSGKKLYEKKRNLAIGGFVTVYQLLDDLRYISDLDALQHQSSKRFLKDELEYRKLRYRLIVWLWPFRLWYLFPTFMYLKNKNKSLKRSDIIFACFPVVVLSFFFRFLRIGVR